MEVDRLIPIGSMPAAEDSCVSSDEGKSWRHWNRRPKRMIFSIDSGDGFRDECQVYQGLVALRL